MNWIMELAVTIYALLFLVGISAAFILLIVGALWAWREHRRHQRWIKKRKAEGRS